MPISEKDIELIQKYLSEQMSSSDQQLFDVKKTDADFKNELLFQSKALDALADVDEKNMIAYLKDENSHDKKGNDENQKTYKPFAYLIGILLLLAIAAFLFKSSKGNKIKSQNEPLALVEKYNQLYPAQLVSRGLDVEENRKLDDALAVYSGGQFEKAFSLLNELGVGGNKTKMYKANCLLQLKKYAEASVLFKELRSESDKKIKENADWYYLMSSMGLENMEEAHALLAEINLNKQHLFNKKAGELLSDLQN